MREAADVQRAAETVEAIAQQLQELNTQLESEIAQLTSNSDFSTEKLETISKRQRREPGRRSHK